jgi:hypothetical protein
MAVLNVSEENSASIFKVHIYICYEARNILWGYILYTVILQQSSYIRIVNFS